jgi:hypothetical protein
MPTPDEIRRDLKTSLAQETKDLIYRGPKPRKKHAPLREVTADEKVELDNIQRKKDGLPF